MANLRIQIIGTNVEYVDKGNGKGYNKMTVTYKDLTPKPQGAVGKAVDVKTLMDFTYPDVFNTLKSSKTNDIFQVVSEKVNNFWTWTEIHRDDGAPPAEIPVSNTQVHVGGKPVATNTYAENNQINKERLEFDKVKQPLIIRQSSLATAVDYMKAQGGKFKVEDVIQVAKQFEDYVNGNTVGQMTDDIPE